MTARLVSWLRTDRGRKRLRYMAVSLISVVVGQATLALAFGIFGWDARSSNLVAFAAGAVPSYWLNRRWTWGKRGRSHVLREMVPFCLMAIAGLALSTWAVRIAEIAALRLTEARAVQTAIVMGSSLGAYGLLWVAKFLAFDRVLFSAQRSIAAGEGGRP
jgi:putative flippase GtrA